jgi:type II secretory pathway pseudopilin PulG
MSMSRPSRHPSRQRWGFTLIEILIAMMFMSFAILSYLWLNQASSRGAMDAYYELLAFSLAREPIEIYRGLGYEQLDRYIVHGDAPLPRYPLGAWTPLTDDPFSSVQYPPEALQFSRHISLTPVNQHGVKAIRITSTVAPKGQSRVELWLTRRAITLESLVMERPK